MSKREEMSKREQMRERQRKAQGRNRLLAIGAVVLVAVLAAVVLILPGLQKADPVSIIQITPLAKSVAVKGTSMGDPNAPVKMDVWEDFQCSGCLSYSQNLEPPVLQTYVETGKVYYTFHFYPFIDGGQGESHDAANAAGCAVLQERFWDYHAMLFANWKGENVGSYTEPRLTAFAEALGLDMPAFNQCFKDKAYAAQIQQDMDAGAKLGVPPTPGIFVNGKMVNSSAGANYLPSVTDVFAAIDAALSGK